jgi:hypothetical protein
MDSRGHAMRMRWMPVAALGLMAGLSGCSVYHDATTNRLNTAGVRWQTIATEADRDRIRGWRKAWDEALPLARKTDAGAIAGDAALFDPDRALPGAQLPAGAYRCRTFKLGANGTGARDFVTYPGFDCRVGDEGEVKSLQKLTGSQRPAGLIFAQSDQRAIFLGTLVLGDETAPLRYGLDVNRDMIGYVERIGPKRWRAVFPYPRFESKLDVLELVPAG